jgi:NAD dependent epimerase/dehydratase family enzyme
LGHVLGRPSFLPLPGFAMKIMFGEMAQTLLQGPRAIPQHLQELGFEFQFPKAEAALRDLLQ